MDKVDIGRLLAGFAAIVFIAYMWVEKEVVSVYTSMPIEEAIPVIVTTIVVSMFKVVGLAAVIYILKWIIRKIRS